MKSVQRVATHAFFISFICLGFFCMANAAAAHRLNVFAWLENDHIIVECGFGDNRPARAANVAVIDSDTKKELVRGVTNEAGQFTFTVPQVVREGHGLLIDVNAGEGHHGEWSMDASELYAAASLTAGFDEAAIAAGGNRQAHAHIRVAPSGGGANMAMPVAPLGGDEARSIINEILESKLAPIRKELAARNAAGPSMAEIIGGIGWIIGLVGIALYFKSRRS